MIVPEERPLHATGPAPRFVQRNAVYRVIFVEIRLPPRGARYLVALRVLGHHSRGGSEPYALVAALEERLAEACTALKVAPDALMCETPSRLDLIREKAAVELGKELKKNEALLHADYDLTLREIRRRLKAEVDNEHGQNKSENQKGEEM